jgi:hypothetical protein
MFLPVADPARHLRVETITFSLPQLNGSSPLYDLHRLVYFAAMSFFRHRNIL